jgi:hypothetical protein
MSARGSRQVAEEKSKRKSKKSFGRPAHEQLVKGLNHPLRTWLNGLRVRGN